MSSAGELERSDDGSAEQDDPAEVLRRVEVQLQRVKLHRGPLPDAELLAQYEDVLPGLADRIVRMAELEQGNRHALERAESQLPYRLAARGQFLAITAIVLVLAFAVFLVATGSPVTGGVVVGADLLGLVTVFVTGQRPIGSDEGHDSSEDHEADSDE